MIININSDYLNTLSIINKTGNFSKIYKYKEGKCLKIWKEVMWSDIEKFKKFTNFKVNCAALPQELVSIDGKFMGYTMDYINGITLENCDNFDFSYFIKKINELIISQQKELGPAGIIVDDIHPLNIMWDTSSNSFKSVDIDNWEVLNLRKDIINNYNFKEMMHAFSTFIFDNGNPYYYDKAYYMDKPEEFIKFYENMKNEIQRQSNIKLKTVGDVKKVLRRM